MTTTGRVYTHIVYPYHYISNHMHLCTSLFFIILIFHIPTYVRTYVRTYADCDDSSEPAECGDSDSDSVTGYGEEVDGLEGVVDMEDIGSLMSNAQRAALKQALDGSSESREMVTKLQRKALTKEGYRIIGTHSAVKLCRWTKNQMRGRGGCYKHTFYGITSYQCMEATPSLACANKCVFCWRHHKVSSLNQTQY